MKFPLLTVLAVSLTLCGCSVFQRSATWDTVVSSRSSYSGSGAAKDDYINHLHQVLSSAGIEHKIVTYQFHYHNVYREEGVDTSTVVLYRDDSTPRDPWWGMDDYHHVPVWLPSWEVDRQVGFFMQRPVEIISVKEYRGSSPAGGEAKAERPLAARKSQDAKLRGLFVNQAPKLRAERSVKPVAVREQRPVKPVAFREQRKPVVSAGNKPVRNVGKTAESQAGAVFRSVHGTTFNAGSSVDRQKMAALSRKLSRKQSSRNHR